MKKIFTCILAMTAGLTSFAQTEAELVRSTVSKSDIEGHMYFLASDELRGRQTGSPEIDIAASYLANYLRRFGIKPAGEDGTYYQKVKLEELSPPSDVNLSAGKMTGGKFLNLKVNDVDFEGDAIFLGYGTEEDFEKSEVEGKWVITYGGIADQGDVRSKYLEGRKKRMRVEENGGLGLIEVLTLGDVEYAQYARYFNSTRIDLEAKEETTDALHLWWVQPDLTLASKWKQGKKIPLKMQIGGVQRKSVAAKNVMGYLEGSDPTLKEEIVVYSAHYDHVGVGKPNSEKDSIFNGARDNAVGTVTVLNVAENISKYPTKRSAMFIFFTAEEKGLLGSDYFVQNPTVALDKIVYCFNSDNGGFNDTSKTTIFGLNRTTVSEHFINAAAEFGLTAIDDPAPEQNLFDRSDNVNFAKMGIPAPTYSMGFTAFDEEILKYYHQVTDNPDTMDYDYLYKFFQSYVLSARLIANDPETPFWTEGDKYYEAGVELYKNKKEAAEVLD